MKEQRVIKFRFLTPDGRMVKDHDGWIEGIGINEALRCSSEYGYKAMQFTGLYDKPDKLFTLIKKVDEQVSLFVRLTQSGEIEELYTLWINQRFYHAAGDAEYPEESEIFAAGRASIRSALDKAEKETQEWRVKHFHTGNQVLSRDIEIQTLKEENERLKKEIKWLEKEYQNKAH